MPFIVDSGATVICAHGGSASATSLAPRVLLSGNPAVTMGSPYTVSGCAMPPPIAGNGPCITGQFLSSATRVMAGGKPVLLMDSQSVCTPTGTPLNITVTQLKVQGQ